MPHDETIQYHSDVSVEDSLEALCFLLLVDSYSIVIKSHPANLSAMKSLRRICDQYKIFAQPFIRKIIWIDSHSIHDLIKRSKAIFTVNSGVGLEALLHQKPVYTFGNADYASVSTKITFGGSKQNAALAISKLLRSLEKESAGSRDENMFEQFIEACIQLIMTVTTIKLSEDTGSLILCTLYSIL